MGISGHAIERRDGKLVVPDQPIVPFIEGDGTGPDIWRASVRVFDAAVEKAYGGRRKIEWLEVLAGEKSFAATGNWLPEETLAAFRKYLVGIKGPLTTPVGGGIRSLNVALRQERDLDGFTRQRDRLRRALGRGRWVEQSIRDGLQPGHLLRPPGPAVRGGLLRERRTPLIAADRIEARVRRHSVQPGSQRRAFLQAVAIPPGTKQRLLHRVLGILQRPEHPVAVDQQLSAMALDGAGELVHPYLHSRPPTSSAATLLVILERSQKLVAPKGAPDPG